MSDAVCRLPRGFVALTLRSARCFMNLIFLITSLVWGGLFFFNARGSGQGSIDEFSETAAMCLNKALFSLPRMLAHRPSSQPVPPGASFPMVPACLYIRSRKLARVSPLGFPLWN